MTVSCGLEFKRGWPFEHFETVEVLLAGSKSHLSSGTLFMPSYRCPVQLHVLSGLLDPLWGFYYAVSKS